MTERELRAVAEAISPIAWKAKKHGFDERGDEIQRSLNLAQAAISASDSRYVKGLVEALKFYRDIESDIDAWKPPHRQSDVARDALQNLPEDLRCPE